MVAVALFAFLVPEEGAERRRLVIQHSWWGCFVFPSVTNAPSPDF
jgi:hypothetical protein